MGLLSDIMHVFTGAAKQQAPAAPTPSEQTTGTTPQPAPVDVNAVLTHLANQTGATNWSESIVDLLKLFKVDSSLENRISLAHELGYTGSTENTAEMNVWLHKNLMDNIRKHGGDLVL